MRRRTDWQMIMLALVITAALIFVVVMAVTMDNIEEQRTKVQDPILMTLEDSVHYYEDGL